MERYSDRAIEIINDLHTERLDYDSEYLPLIDCANRCKAYEDAEEQGLLVNLPCKRGNKVWRICGPKKRKFVAERTVLSVTMYDPGDFEIFTNCFDWLGKTVFLTREEAEAALKEMNRNG